ncbi:MAG: antirestriction protein ArdA [Bacteroidia bacterium]|nr:antirestriction protein ArdA [Bacteroidia bacterium]
MGISQGPSLKTWFDEFEDLDYWELLAALYLAQDLSYTIKDILDFHLDNVFFFEGSAEDYAREEIDSSGLLDALPQYLQYYFDYKSYSRDLVLSGDISEWQDSVGNCYIVREA